MSCFCWGGMLILLLGSARDDQADHRAQSASAGLHTNSDCAPFEYGAPCRPHPGPGAGEDCGTRLTRGVTQGQGLLRPVDPGSTGVWGDTRWVSPRNPGHSGLGSRASSR